MTEFTSDFEKTPKSSFQCDSSECLLSTSGLKDQLTTFSYEQSDIQHLKRASIVAKRSFENEVFDADRVAPLQQSFESNPASSDNSSSNDENVTQGCPSVFEHRALVHEIPAKERSRDTQSNENTIHHPDNLLTIQTTTDGEASLPGKEIFQEAYNQPLPNFNNGMNDRCPSAGHTNMELMGNRLPCINSSFEAKLPTRSHRFRRRGAVGDFPIS